METLFFIAPAYNEAAYIESFLQEWYPIVARVAETDAARMVIVDDGSTDGTGPLLDALAISYPLLTVLHKKNGGHGATLLYGYRYAIEQGADYIFQTDSDGQTRPEEFPAFWQARHRYEAQFGMRPHRQDGKGRLFVENTLRLIVRLFFGVSVPDANAPFRLMRADCMRDFLPLMPDDYSLPNVILTSAFVRAQRSVRFAEITFRPRQGGKNSINLRRIGRIGIQALSDFYHIRKKMRRMENTST